MIYRSTTMPWTTTARPSWRPATSRTRWSTARFSSAPGFAAKGVGLGLDALLPEATLGGQAAIGTEIRFAAADAGVPVLDSIVDTEAAPLVENVLADTMADGGVELAPKSGVARFCGEPFAFGTGARSAHVDAIVNEAAQASGISDLSTLVDDVVYDPAGSYFTVDNGRQFYRWATVRSGERESGQLMEAGHEIVHAQQFDRFWARGGYATIDDAADAFFNNVSPKFMPAKTGRRVSGTASDRSTRRRHVAGTVGCKYEVH